MKKLIAFVLVISLLLVFLVGCASLTKDPIAKSTTSNSESVASNNTSSATTEKKEIIIGVNFASFEFTFVTYLMDAMKSWEKEHPEVKIEYTDAKNDASTQLGQIENAVDRVDAMIVMPVDPKTVNPIIEKCKSAGVPLIGLNRRFSGADSYVGAKSIDAGIIQAEEVIKLTGGKGNVAILTGIMGQESQVQRMQGNKDIFAKYPDIKVILEGTGEWKRDKGMTVIENWLQAREDINVILAHNDEMAIGASKAVVAAGKKDKIIIGSVDGTLNGLNAVKDGSIDFTVFQDPIGQAKTALDFAKSLANKEKVEPEIFIPFELVDKANVDQYIAKFAK